MISELKNMPMIRLELEGMRQAILHSFLKYNSELNKAVDEALKNAVSADSFFELVDREVREAVNECVAKEIKGYFGWGEGRKMISETIEAAFKNKSKKKRTK